MKKQTKIWLFVLAFALMITLVFTVGALAADEAPALDPTSPLYTPYGMISEQYASVEDYPFVAFDSKGNCLGGSKVFVKDDEKDPAIVHFIQKKAQSDVYYIYLRTDYTQSASSYNFQFINSTVIVDLGGHTFSYSQTISAQMKLKGNNPRVTFKNGTMHAAANKSLFSTNTIDNSASGRASALHITFENITFTVFSGFSSGHWISYTDPSKNDPNVGLGGYQHSVTFKSCTFDLTNITKSVNIVTIGQKTGQIAEDIKFLGVHFIGDMKNVVFANKSYDLACSVTFGANEKGEILTNTRLTSLAVESPAHVTVDGVAMSPCVAVSTEGDYTTYTLGTHERLTPYGWIPEDVYKNEDYTLLLFNINTGVIVWKGDRWGGEGTEGGALSNLDANDGKGSHAIYFQGDHIDVPNSAGKTPTYYNFGCIVGNHIIDFNGYTLTSTSDNIFHSQAKNANTTSKASFLVKNGTINLGNKYLIMSGSISRATECAMQSDFVFENMNFVNVKSSGGLVSDTSYGTFKTVTNITMRNCTVEVTESRTTSLFNVASNRKGTANVTVDGATVAVETASLNHTFNIVLEGGKVVTNEKKIVPIFPTANLTGRTLTYTSGQNGYTELHTAVGMTTYSDYQERNTDSGARYFILDETTESAVIYRLGIKTKYGYVASHLLDAEKYPILVFQKKLGYATAGFDHLGGEGDAAGVWSYVHRLWGEDSYILLQADLSASQTNIYYNWGAAYGTHLFDLNGHTITLGNNFIQAQMKSKQKLSFTFINGTISVGYRNLVAVGAGESDTTNSTDKEVDILFENIRFNVANGYLVYDMNKGKFHNQTNVEFRNCHFEITNAQTKALCYLGASSVYDICVTFTGGTMNYQGANVSAHLQNNNNVPGHTVTYLPYNGAYTTVTTLNTVDMASRVYPSGDTVATLYKLSGGEKTTTYRLTPYGFISAYLNLTNDLNLVYRTFVPTLFTNPSVTFTVGTSTVTVTEYTMDENGYYCYKLPNINPARMGETVTAVLNATYGDKTMTVTHNTLSVKTYAETVKAQNTDNASLVELIEKLLVYGASAQQYLGQSEEDFVVSISALADISAEEYTLTMSGETSDKGAIAYFGMNIDGAFAFRLGIVANVEGLTLTAKGGEKITTYNLDDYTAKDGVITIVYDGILANELDEAVTFTLTLGDEVVGKTLTTNANSYLYRASVGNSETLATLAKALYAYGECAKNYKA